MHQPTTRPEKRQDWVCLFKSVLFHFTSRIFSTNYEDLKTLMETLLLVSALLLSFSISSFQNISHDDLVGGDSRYFTLCRDPSFIRAQVDDMMLDGKCKNNETMMQCWAKNEYYFAYQNGALTRQHIPSFRYLNANMSAMMSFLCVMVLGMTTYASLAFSKCSEDAGFLESFSGFYNLAVIGGYVAVVNGIFLLFRANHALADLTLPMYSRNLSLIYDPVSKQMTEGGWWTLQDEYREQKDFCIKVMIVIAAVVCGVHVILNLLFPGKSGTAITCAKQSYHKPENVPLERWAVYATILEKQELDQEQLVGIEPKVFNSRHMID
jgi:hypothetical protein